MFRESSSVRMQLRNILCKLTKAKLYPKLLFLTVQLKVILHNSNEKCEAMSVMFLLCFLAHCAGMATAWYWYVQYVCDGERVIYLLCVITETTMRRRQLTILCGAWT